VALLRHMAQLATAVGAGVVVDVVSAVHLIGASIKERIDCISSARTFRRELLKAVWMIQK
jgi:hypothetical protein